MKIKKSKKLIYLLASITFVSLIGVGFSSWVLDKIEGDSAKISAEIGLIDNKTLVASIDESASDLEPVRFDANDGKGGIVANGDTQSQEKMTFKVVFDIQAGYEINKGNIAISFTFDDIAKKYTELLDGQTQYIDTSCLKDCEINLPTQDGVVNNASSTISSSVNFADDNTGARITSAFTFKWGKAFGGKNPCESTDQSVVKTLTDFESAYKQIGSDKGFTVTITPKDIGN